MYVGWMWTCVWTNIFELQDGLDDDSFENYKSGLMGKLLEKDPSLTYESNRLWNQIVDKRYFTYFVFDIFPLKFSVIFYKVS